MMRTAMMLVMASLACAVLVGCGEETTIAGDTPQATAENFIEAMKAGNYENVAAGFDYETWAARENPDWDTFGEHQRTLIVEKLQEDKVTDIRALAGMFTTGEASVESVQQQGEQATATVNAGANTLILRMRQIEGEWLLSNITESTSG